VAALGFEEAVGARAVVDSSIVARDGTTRQASMQRVPGRFGSAMRFDGVDDWVTITDTANSALDLTNGMTLEAWVQPTAAMSGWETILMKERGAENMSYALYARDGAPTSFGTVFPVGYIRQAPAASTQDEGARGVAEVAVGVWTHLAVTWDRQSIKFFVNGVQVSEHVPPTLTNIVQGNGALRLGGNNSFPGEFFQGLIDEVRVYNRARTAAQITSDMNTPVVP
jgi:hypothetical protein